MIFGSRTPAMPTPDTALPGREQPGFAVPVTLLLLSLIGGGVGVALSGPAAAMAICGMLAERWLMFAQATHTVTLYYGAPRAA